MAMKGIKLRGNKGITVWDMSNVAFTLVFIGVALAVGMWVNLEFADTVAETAAMNQSITFVNNTWHDLSYRADGINFVGNASHNLGAANYTTKDLRYITQINATFYGDYLAAAWNVNYNAFNFTDRLIVMNATEGMSKMAQWLPIIMIVFAAAIVLASLALWFGRR